MKKIILIAFIFIFSSCSYYVETNEKKSQCIENGFVLDKKLVPLFYANGQPRTKNGITMTSKTVIVIDSCDNQTTYITTEDCYNSLQNGGPVKVYKTNKKKLFLIKKTKNKYE